MKMDLEAIKAREAAATPGPWEATEKVGHISLPHLPEVQYRVILGPDEHELAAEGYDYDDPGVFPDPADAEFIAHAREDVPALVAEVERLWSLLRDRSEVGGPRPSGMVP